MLLKVFYRPSNFFSTMSLTTDGCQLAQQMARADFRCTRKSQFLRAHCDPGQFLSLNEGLLGIFFTTHSAVLIEDVPLTEEDTFKDLNPPQRAYDVYQKVGYNCFIAAAMYVVCGLFSWCQMRLNKKKEYLVQ
uniref:Uncharacterized protein n=1 Tax=Oreochromis aureus TaxID=47969 RepID=A0AAZ1X8P4_OREAU